MQKDNSKENNENNQKDNIHHVHHNHTNENDHQASTNSEDFEGLFWADQLAQEIINREKFRYLDNKIQKPDMFTVKTSASLSGVLHIGRLSDTIRGSSVYQALKDAGVKARLIWVAEDMDPLRKVPEGVPADYEKYIGMSVTDIPDPNGCHSSYAEHHVSEYFKVIDEFVSEKMEKFSMRAEYRAGNFKPYIKKILENIETITEIQNRYRTNPLKKGWSSWTPICDNCGKIITPRVTDFVDGKVLYTCKDYAFEKYVAKGCGYKGENDPLKGNGKMVWKSEWASQWARWQVVSEGAGKEYQVPNSAFWINAEIVEKVHGFPAPVPIFYEHLMIDSVKMSASVGNVVYPADWLEVASPEMLRLFYNKRLMTTRSFSWKDLPNMYDEEDHIIQVVEGKISLENMKEEMHLKRLFEISHGHKKTQFCPVPFSHAVVVVQTSEKEEDVEKILKKTGHWDDKKKDVILNRISKAKTWVEKYAPDEAKFKLQNEVPESLSSRLSEEQKKALHMLADKLPEKDWDDKTLFNEIYEISKETGVKAKDLFKAGYNVLLNKDRGPKLAPFILIIGKEKAAELFGKV